LAFSYQRVSDPKQTRDGRAGLDRQADAFNGFCQRNGLIPNADPVVDRGLSAFHGRHRSKGALGAFIAAAKAGEIPLGSVLVVEDVDRLTREVADKQLRLLLEFFDSGLAVGVIRDDWVIDLDHYNGNPALRLVLQTRFDAANDYSQKLSGRISDVWQRRQRDWIEQRKPYLGKGSRPEWLTDDGSRFVEIPETVALVQRMFKLCAEENMGGTQIAEKLNAEGFKPAKSDAYGPTRILRILHDRRVLGEKQWPDGSTSPDYFPRIVNQSLWDACQKAIDQRHDNKGRHGRGEVIANLFQGGSFCACGRALYLQTARNRQGVVAYAVLRCTGKRKHTCPQPPGDWKYDEEALLLAFMAQRWSKFFDRPSDNRKRRELEEQLRELETLATTQQKQAATAAKNLAEEMAEEGMDKALGRFYAEAASKATTNAEATQKRIHALQAELQQVNRRPSGQDMQKQIQERVRAFMTSDRHDVAERRRFNNWFLGLGVRVTVRDPKLSRLQWGATDTVIYRDQANNVVSDETLGDMAVLGFSEVDIARREADIRGEVG
jgi:DNA invertase Pin-like site-specific DNA recombinase